MSRGLRKARAPRRTPVAGAPTPTSTRTVEAGRVDAVDAMRGIALCLMFAYHFTFDLRLFQVIAADFENDPLCSASAR